MIEIKYLQVIVMPNKEVICMGKTIGYSDKLEKYLLEENDTLKKEYQNQQNRIND